MDPGERGLSVRHESGPEEAVDRDEPLDVFVDLCFVGFIRPLRHRGSSVLGKLARTHDGLCRHQSWVWKGMIMSVCNGHGSRQSRSG